MRAGPVDQPEVIREFQFRAPLSRKRGAALMFSGRALFCELGLEPSKIISNQSSGFTELIAARRRKVHARRVRSPEVRAVV